MLILKCKICGGSLNIQEGQDICTCEYCGTRQTLPKLDNERKLNLYDRASHLRRNSDFDKASVIYEQILSEDKSDAEAYWSLVLCKYGVEYVEDPSTHKRIPTVNRTQFTSIFNDPDYKEAIDHASIDQKVLYEEEARKIDDIQKGILDISKKEKPYDIFICYKETDNNGRRTLDSVLAQDIYKELTREGYKVFFSRITLEDKIGMAYEPYIFAALNSAKVMIVVGTSKENFNAVWVRNEWSRYLSLMKKDDSKVLVPCYRDMDPYDMPEEFAYLQAQDMSKLGFMQDLVRGIDKITGKNKKENAANSVLSNTVTPSANIEALLKRGNMFLEDGDFKAADEYFDRVLDNDPENGEAYLGKLMAELHVQHLEDLQNCDQPFDSNNNYQKVIRFSDSKIKEMLSGYIEHIIERNENTRLVSIYKNAVNSMESADNEQAFKSAAETFKTISNFKDADELAKQCLERAEMCRKDAIYNSAKSHMASNTEVDYEEAAKLFNVIVDWKDSNEQIIVCQKKIEERKIETEKAVKKRKKIIAIVTPIIIACIAFVIVLTTVIIPENKYSSAMELYNSQQYEEAYKAFNSLNFKDSADKAAECLFMKQKARLTNVTIGSIIKFGFYEQDYNASNGKEEIEWKVLAVEENKALIISQYALDCQQYNTSYTNVTWETCTLRKWLNETFYNAAFGTYHQQMVSSSTDRVFLLNITEANKYFSSKSARQCHGTEYCYAQGAYKASNGNCWWWLQSPGSSPDDAAYVSYDGSVNYNGVNNGSGAVRPALWISIE